jgi:hypothetical protein
MAVGCRLANHSLHFNASLRHMLLSKFTAWRQKHVRMNKLPLSHT